MKMKRDACQCAILSRKLAQHEEVIAQLVQMLAVLNRTVSKISNAQS